MEEIKGEEVRPIDYLAAGLAGAFAASLLNHAQAQELLIHGPSLHFNEGHNNQTYGVGYQYKDFLGGIYYNSERETSVYGGYRIGLTDNWGVIVGLVTGYERCSVCPAALLTYRIPVSKSINLHFNAAPIDGGFVNLTVGVRH